MIKNIFTITLLLSLALNSFSLVFAQEPYSAITEVECDAENPCPEGQECISFPLYRNQMLGNRCAKPNPCSYYQCPEGTECLVAESYPLQVMCSETQEPNEEINLDEEVSSEDLGIKEPRLLPNNSLYFLKEWGRKARLFLSFNSVSKAELKSRYANERLIELKELINSNANQEDILKAIDRYKEEIQGINEISSKIKEKATENENVEKFLDKFIQHQFLHNRILQKIEEEVPEEVMNRIRETREEHLRKFGEVMNRLEEKERIQKRIEENLEKVKGSEFKEFKNIEVLKELEELVPEEAKEAIINARENSLRRLKEQAENWSEENQGKFQEYLQNILGDKEKRLEMIEDLKSELPSNSQVRERIKEARMKIIGGISMGQLEDCVEIEQLEDNFCEDGRILVVRNENGCIEEYKCIETGEQEQKRNQERACITLWNPVCGQDGKTYSNSCFAEAAGVKITHEGICPEETKKEVQEKAEEIKEGIKEKIEEKIQERPKESKEGISTSLIECLEEKDVIFYGSKTCPACASLVNSFGGYDKLESIYVECSEEWNRCSKEMKTTYVPEIHINNELYQGSRDPDSIARATNCNY
jgi:hypothetical protein